MHEEAFTVKTLQTLKAIANYLGNIKTALSEISEAISEIPPSLGLLVIAAFTIATLLLLIFFVLIWHGERHRDLAFIQALLKYYETGDPRLLQLLEELTTGPVTGLVKKVAKRRKTEGGTTSEKDVEKRETVALNGGCRRDTRHIEEPRSRPRQVVEVRVTGSLLKLQLIGHSSLRNVHQFDDRSSSFEKGCCRRLYLSNTSLTRLQRLDI